MAQQTYIFAQMSEKVCIGSTASVTMHGGLARRCRNAAVIAQQHQLAHRYYHHLARCALYRQIGQSEVSRAKATHPKAEAGVIEKPVVDFRSLPVLLYRLRRMAKLTWRALLVHNQLP